jgi:hypothetical protein
MTISLIQAVRTAAPAKFYVDQTTGDVIDSVLLGTQGKTKFIIVTTGDGEIMEVDKVDVYDDVQAAQAAAIRLLQHKLAVPTP